MTVINLENAFIISDLHLGDEKIMKYRPEFQSIEEHNNTILENWRVTVSESDTVFVLGDIAKGEEMQKAFKSLPGHKVLVLGNWDAPPKVWLENGYDEVHAMLRLWFYDDEDMVLRTVCTHAPIDVDMCEWEQNFHGHVHRHSTKHKKHLNVSAEICEYKPQKIEKFINQFFDNTPPKLTHVRMVVA